MRKSRKSAIPWLLSSLLVLAGLLAASCSDSDSASIQTVADAADAASVAANAASADAAAAMAQAELAQRQADLAMKTAEGQQEEIAAAQRAVQEAEAKLAEATQQAAAAQQALEAATTPGTQGEPVVEPPAPTDELVIAITTEPSTLDAQEVNDRASRVVTGNIFEALLFRDRNANLSPGLATSWRNVNDTTWEFTLREGVVFHDGSPFNAESAAYSVNRIVDENYETQRGSYINGIVSAAAKDEYTLEVTTDGPNAILLLQMAQLPMVALNAGDAIKEEPVGTGPYRFVEWNRGESITAELNLNYWGEPGSIPRFSVRVISDAQTALAALQNGEVHLVLDILPEQAGLVPKSESVPATEYSYIAFNTYVTEMSDPRVRIAMNLAVDKESLAEDIYEGFARPNQAQHLSPGSTGFNPDIEPFPYDPEKAKELLAEAGYADGFEVTLNIPIGRYLRAEESGRIIAQQLRDIGLDVVLRLWEWNEYRSAGRIPGKEEGALDLKYGWNSNEWFDGARTASHVTCDGRSSKICDEYVSERFAIGATELDQDVRSKAYQEAWARLHENPHAIYLLQQDLIYGMAANLEWEPRLDDEYYISEMSFS